MSGGLPLPRVQRWLQSVIVHPGTVQQALRDPAAARELPAERLADAVLPSRSLSAAERIGIYHGMYPLRMEEALATDYPGVKHFLGDRAFLELVRAYVQVHPSTHFSLNHLGDRFPDFIANAQGVRRRDFCHDLARLEHAISQVFDAPETRALDEQAIAAVPPDAWERARLTPIAAFRVLALRHPVSAWLDSLDDEQHRHPGTRRRESWAVVYRREYSVYRLDLARPAHDLLADLASGLTLGEAIAAALERGPRRRPAEDELFRWFRQWVSAGVFASVDLAAAARA